MSNEELLKEILNTEKKQLAVLEDLLSEQKSNNRKYAEYLDNQQKANDEYRLTLEESAEESARRDADRVEQHESYVRGAVVARYTNYVRALASICLVSLIGYWVVFGIKV